MRGQFSIRRGNAWQCQMTVSQSTSVARNVLDHRKNAAIQMAGDGNAAASHATADPFHFGGITANFKFIAGCAVNFEKVVEPALSLS